MKTIKVKKEVEWGCLEMKTGLGPFRNVRVTIEPIEEEG